MTGSSRGVASGVDETVFSTTAGTEGSVPDSAVDAEVASPDAVDEGTAAVFGTEKVLVSFSISLTIGADVLEIGNISGK